MDANPKTQVIERLKSAQNVLITVSNDPSVDQLAAAIGFALLINKLGKHATAVFSGQIPSTLEFLKPEDTLEPTTDSLRDFIISLDKSKADKLRYKVEENVVKIFITPYRTSLNENDLEFSQGDFNVDAVVALGVDEQAHIDQAIMAHGRILHDATVIGIAAGQNHTEVGSINWIDPAASSLSEMLVSISEAFQSGLLDNQISTAFLTGIVAETDRFSNDKTSPKVMTMAAQLMAAGANQQLIATKLALPPEPPTPSQPVQPDNQPPVVDEPESTLPPVSQNGPETETNQKDKSASTSGEEGIISLHKLAEPLPPPPPVNDIYGNLPKVQQIDIDKEGTLHNSDELSKRTANFNRGKTIEPPKEPEEKNYEGYMKEPPQSGSGSFTANSEADDEIEPSIDPLSMIPEAPIPPHDSESYLEPEALEEPTQVPNPQANEAAAPAAINEPDYVDPLGVEPMVNPNPMPPLPQPQVPFSHQVENPDAAAARKAVNDAVNSAGAYDAAHPQPIQALNAQPFGEVANHAPSVPPPLVPPFPIPPNQGTPNIPDNNEPDNPLTGPTLPYKP